MGSKIRMKLTEKIFWENFWNTLSLPVNVNYKFNNDRAIANTIKKYIPNGNFTKTAIEIGCAPGKWLTFFIKELNYNVTGMEYLESAVQKTVENMNITGIPREQYEIIPCDFLNFSSSRKYDVVYSLGFLEHFSNWENVFDKHLELCMGGYVVISFPNFNGINYIFQKIIDKYLKYPLLPNHNLKIMNLHSLVKYAKKRGLSVCFCDYIGGFEPALFNTDVIRNKIIYFLLVKSKHLFTRLFGHFNTVMTSSYIIFIFKKS